MDGGEANLRLEGGLNLLHCSDLSSLQDSRSHRPPAAPSLGAGAGFTTPKPWRSVVNCEVSRRGAGGTGDTHLALVSSLLLTPSSAHLLIARWRRRWLPDLQQEIWTERTQQQEPCDGSSCCWVSAAPSLLGGGFLCLWTHAVTKVPPNWSHIKPAAPIPRQNHRKVPVSASVKFSRTVNLTSHNAGVL